MKKKPMKKLQLNRETIQLLEKLTRGQGAGVQPTDNNMSCPSC